MKRYSLPTVCALITIIIRIVVFSFFQDSIFYQPLESSSHDRAIYINAAEAASRGEFFSDGALEFLPLYPWLLGLLGTVFGTGPFTAAVFGMVCDAITTFIIVLFARRLGAIRLMSVIAGLLYAAYPLAAIYSLLAMPNTLNTLLVTAFVFFAHRLLTRIGSAGASPSQDNPTKREGEAPAEPMHYVRLLTLGLFAGIATLGFAGMILITLSVAVIAQIKTRSFLAPILLIIGMAIPIAPVAIHNTRAEGSFVVLTTHGGFNFYMGNHERATGYPLKVMNFRMTAKEMLEDAHRHAERMSGKNMTRAESAAWWKREANRYWEEHPADALGLTAKKAALFWNFREMDDLRILEQLRITEPFFRNLVGTPFALFGLLGLVGLVFARGSMVPRLTLLAGFGGIVLFFITARYRLTFVPLMAILGVAGLTQLVTLWKSGNRPRTLLAIPLAAIVFIPFQVRDQRPIDYHNTAIKLIAERQLDEAREIVNRGLEIDPNFGSLYLARGNILFAQEKFTEAAEAFKTARTLMPENQTVSYNLALSLARAGDYCGARDALMEYKKRAPLPAQTEQLLQELIAACGK